MLKQRVTLRQELEKEPRYRTEDICLCSVGKDIVTSNLTNVLLGFLLSLLKL
jgi:hypothetical protein